MHEQVIESLYDLNGNLRYTIDGLARITQYEYDHWNRLFRVTQPAAVVAGTQPVTLYGYDLNNNRTSLTDPNSNTTTWHYDTRNRMEMEEVSWTSEDRTYTYDDNGNLTDTVDRDGRHIHYVYDHRNRRTAEEWMDGATVVRTISYDYDDADRLESVSDPDATYEFHYDDDGNLEWTDVTFPDLADVVRLTNAYGVLGNREHLTVDIGSTHDFVNDYTYDTLQRVDTIKQHGNGGNAVAEKFVDFGYNAASQLSSLVRWKNLAGSSAIGTSSYGYDSAGRLTSLNSPFANQSWAFVDKTDLIYSFTHSVDGTVTYTYDRQNQLTGWTGAASRTYDLAGNNSSFDVDPGNRVMSNGSLAFDYDAEGNETRKDAWHYEFDYRNRLTAALYYDGETLLAGIHYVYDAFNQRIGRWMDSFGTNTADYTEYFIYDGDDVALDFEDLDGEGTSADPELRTRYLFGPAVDQILAQENVTQGGSAVSTSAADRVYWFFGDHQGTTRELVANNASLREHYEYNPFGMLVYGSVTSYTRYLYTGREFDELTGLQYNRNRWYDPELERWMSQDPIGFDGGDANLYRYASNRATVSRDPSGLAAPMDAVATELVIIYLTRVALNPPWPLPAPPWNPIGRVLFDWTHSQFAKLDSDVSRQAEYLLRKQIGTGMGLPIGNYSFKDAAGIQFNSMMAGGFFNKSDLSVNGTISVTCVAGHKSVTVSGQFVLSDRIDANSFDELYKKGYFNSDSPIWQKFAGLFEGAQDILEKVKQAEDMDVTFTWTDSITHP